ncbi:ATP-binding protein [Bordetella holmesii]|uniref:C4-dicarboxylate transport sensor protein DctB n=2 Tax=Bordetella holmesii TaxID=35814 RepID=A0A158M419_9BORD|nr:ATP-binding protein [Bordetella holmesii]AHV94025.1 C4-dicarboxylate transport sensor protein dctB [Bordetella holmesii ATCC 51541]AIT24740.1 C4-dicarboxylate transport sensor protein dctB [Bordetella holmesii 44057]AMD44038.1 C4-dicarboxylate ABC transporter [Bordetella holmesii H558]EWM45306.1 C4-dicarboxylate transport sensor protein dctB [Bordetella holmesii 70147]EWM49425.1 C4-dicarboxylate transport sensor protein dctB [Bordetella holmesii 35009]EXF90245.1 C4-dicarboxylate transport 
MILLAATQWAESRALREVAARADATTQLNTVALRSSLEKFRAVPHVLARDAEVHQALTERRQSAVEILDAKLAEISHAVGSSAIYILDRQGVAVAASNWREPATFVGVDYQFRPYFQRAMADGQAEYFALGTISHEAGLYISRRIDDVAGHPLGVAVLKMDFQQQEADWKGLPDPLFVTDEQGVVLISNVPQWQFHSIGPLPAALTERLQQSLQFGQGAVTELPLAPSLADGTAHALTRNTAAALTMPPGTLLMHSARAVPASPNWTLHTLVPVQASTRRAISNIQLTVVLIMAFAYAGGGLMFYRRRLLRERVRAQLNAKARLERRVRMRTRQLRQSNEQLVAQIDERQRTETRLHEMQDELVQANKLALLGQIAAGVAHEINQPLSAIRAYADNAQAFLKRGDPQHTEENLRTIAALTDRIGSITGELRAFSRKGRACITDLPVHQAIDGALLLMGPRLHRQDAVLAYTAAPPELRVRADRSRLEQVLVNLLQNALDAATHQPRLTLRVQADADFIRLSLTDNGPGIAPQILQKLFTPFQTTKAEGLGLGLVICQDILTECGATLDAANTPEGGAVFEILLRRAPDAPDLTS